MTRLAKASMGYLVWIAAGTHPLAEAFERPDTIQTRLILHIVNNAETSERVISEAKTQVERIFNQAGIQIGWDKGIGLKLTVVLTGRAPLPDNEPGSQVAGMAIGNNGQGARWAYIFMSRIKEQSNELYKAASLLDTRLQIVGRNRKYNEALILGHVIAHEVGHLMLPCGAHSASGIMSAVVDGDKYRQVIDGKLLFSPDQSTLMQSLLLTRAND